jgi:hypothetical protein
VNKVYKARKAREVKLVRKAKLARPVPRRKGDPGEAKIGPVGARGERGPVGIAAALRINTDSPSRALILLGFRNH